MKKLYAGLFLMASILTYSNDYTSKVESLNLKEVADNFNDYKAVLKGLDVKDLNENEKKSLALLLDLSILTKEDFKNKNFNKLNSFIEDNKSVKENYIGNASDKNISERVLDSYERAKTIDPAKVKEFNKLVEKGIITGFSAYDNNFNSNFNKDLKITYGHSNPKHLVKLIALLEREGLDPKIQLVPKTSAFEFLPEWGEPGKEVIKLESGKMISLPKEYDVEFQFDNKKELEKFRETITTYAKKDSEDEKGLIIESWWQPFYRVENNTPGYKKLVKHIVDFGDYRVETLIPNL